MRSLRPVLFFLFATAFICQGSSAQDKLSVELTDVREDLQPFEDTDRYDYVEDEFEYFVIDEEKYDAIFYRSTLLAAQLHQLREASDRYEDGSLSLEESEDTDFLTLMIAEAVVTLPDIVTEAQRLASEISDLNPKRDFWRKPLVGVQALRGLRLAGQNLKTIVSAQDNIGELLEDYEALQSDLDLVESEQAQG